MKLTRQHLLLGVLVIVGLFQVADYVLNSLIQGPLEKLQNEKPLIY